MSESERQELQELVELVRGATRQALESGRVVATLEGLEGLPAPVALMTTLIAAATLAVAGVQGPGDQPLPLGLFKGLAAVAWNMVNAAAREKAAERVVDEAVARAQAHAAAEAKPA